MKTAFWCAIILPLLAAGCSTSEVSSRQPNLSAGGRAVAIAVRPDNDKRMVVASETGGLFRTFDSGVTWLHVGGLPSHFLHDVSFASLGPDILLATTRSRFRAVNDGGIWRSTNGGASWVQPPGSMLPASLNCPSRPSAYDVSFLPLSRTVYVATDCGLARSDDNGVTWTHLVLDPSAPRQSDSLQNRVWSVSVLNRTSGVAAADGNRGIWHLDGAGMWRRSLTGPLGGATRTFHAFAGSPASAAHYFHIGRDTAMGRQLWVTTDGGTNWSPVSTPSLGGRESFIRSARAVSGDDRTFNLYLGTGVKLFRQVFTHTAGGPVGTGTWTQLTTDHADPADVAFDIDRRTPILLATDGGLHRTTNGGANWTFTGGGVKGYNALQITEITGQEVAGTSPHLDLYFGTQDNDIKASPDGGATWPGSRCCEGFFFRVAPQSTNHDNTLFTGAACGGCGTFSSKAHLTAQASWPNPPDGDTVPNNTEFEGTPFLIVPDAYLQSSINNTTPAQVDYRMTLSTGSAWSFAYSLTAKPRGPARFAGFLANPTVFQGHVNPGALPNGGKPYALFRIRTIATTPQVERADSVGIGALGVLKTMFAFYTVFGVDPNHADRLIAPDLRNNEMKLSRDGGRTWQSYPALTTAVTDNGLFRFSVGDEPLASVISFDPYDSCHIIVATAQRGILRSTDGGASWKALKGSSVVTYPTSVYFPRTGRPWVSSYGRGLWQLKVSRRTSDGNCAFVPRVPPVATADSTIVFDVATGAARTFRSLSDACPRCQFLTANHGWFTGYRALGDSLTELSISGGMIAQIDTSGRGVEVRVANTYTTGEWQSDNRAIAGRIRPPLRVRAVGVEGGRLRVLIAATGDSPIPAARLPDLQVLGVSSGGGLPTARSGDRVRLVGTGFVPVSARGSAVRVLVNGVVAVDRLEVRGDGTFTVALVVSGAVGSDMDVVAEQRDGLRLTRVETSLRVVPSDG